MLGATDLVHVEPKAQVPKQECPKGPEGLKNAQRALGAGMAQVSEVSWLSRGAGAAYNKCTHKSTAVEELSQEEGLYRCLISSILSCPLILGNLESCSQQWQGRGTRSYTVSPRST